MGNGDNTRRRIVVESGWSSMYGLAFLGALVYFIQHSTSFWGGVLGVIEAIFWPGVILYKVLEMLKV